MPQKLNTIWGIFFNKAASTARIALKSIIHHARSLCLNILVQFRSHW